MSMHVIGAGLGGALTGLALGGAGALLDLGRFRLPVVLGAAAIAAWLAYARKGGSLGSRMTPRRLRSPSLRVHFFASGMRLGSGLVTLIPYTVFVALAAALATAPLPIAVAAGAVFGLAREAPTFATVLTSVPPAGYANITIPPRIPNLVNAILVVLVAVAAVGA
nr:hypothetical protein [uncultured bacterium]